MKRKPSRESFWEEVARERHEVFMVWIKAYDQTSFETMEHEYLALQKKLLKGARTDWERRHIKRLIAHDILNVAHSRAQHWEEFSRVLRRIERLGFIDLSQQVHTACMTLLWMASHDQGRASLAWAMMEDATRRLRHVRRGHFLRREGLDSIAIVSQRAIRAGLTPPPDFDIPEEKPRRRSSRPRLRLLPSPT